MSLSILDSPLFPLFWFLLIFFWFSQLFRFITITTDAPPPANKPVDRPVSEFVTTLKPTAV
jgi:hypothetical protein